MPGCRGRSPRRNNLRVSPFPAGEGGWGNRGQESIDTAGKAGTAGYSTPPGTRLAGSVSAAGGLILGMQGAEPLAKNNFGLPLPAGEGGWGDRGQESIDTTGKAGAAGYSTPPGTRLAGSVSAAGGLILGMQGAEPLAKNNFGLPLPAGEGGWGDRGQESIDTTGKAGAAGYSTRPAGGKYGRANKCRRRSNAGDARGGAPCKKTTLVSPFPAGEGGRGVRGQEIKLKAGATGDQKSKPPSGTTAARIASAAGGKPPLSFPQRQG